ncbi:nitroreductase [Strigomonas culicis]|uniref:Nitroreductase n=1 Tax=Strigomonas culicis TaxID=28005 RepID=S9UWS6_9TRYP|nr:nitroreductase [Strigomonas culicis]|eukprot:EPY14965.1 nitroreductase [Strigomonas culicis]
MFSFLVAILVPFHSLSTLTFPTSSSPPDPLMSAATEFLKALQQRRSIYSIGRKPLSLTNEQVVALVQGLVREAPSAFNVQSSRAVILFGAQHEKLWDIALEGMKAHGVSGDALGAAKQKIASCFAAGVGTVLFFEDTAAIDELKKNVPAYAHNYDSFSLQASGMAQYAVWSALAQAQIGGTMQHYNELIEADVRKQFDVPASWKLISQLPFGSIEAPAQPRTYIPDEGRFLVKGL